MLSEYVKYIFARLRMGLNPTAAAAEPGLAKPSVA
jgi:hypothetical protein